MTTKDFHIGDILTVTTEVFCTPNGMDGLYGILNWMTSDNLFTHQLPRASRECAPELLRQHPDLAEVKVPRFGSEAEGRAWIAEQVATFGETRPVIPLSAVDHTEINPIAELTMMKPGGFIIGVQVDEGGRS